MKRYVRRCVRRVVGPAQIDESYIVYAALKHRRGVMVDVGAHYGHTLAPFARDGWDVHAFEPDAANRAELETHYGRYSNVTIVSEGVSDRIGEVPFFTSDESTGISALTPFTPGHRRSATVRVTTLREYLARAGLTAVDFLKIDVEGHERNVLNGHDWDLPPRVVLLEFEDAKTLQLGYRWTDLADELVRRGYDVLVSEWFPIERYGAAHRWRRFATYPATLADPDAWGNLIATSEPEQIGPAVRQALRRLRMRQRLEALARRAVPRAG